MDVTKNSMEAKSPSYGFALYGKSCGVNTKKAHKQVLQYMS